MTTLGYLELRGGGSRVTMVPALGGRITALEMAGRQWLCPHPEPVARDAVDLASYMDAGGYDECFPTVLPCSVPSGTPHFGGAALPDHGELWSHQPAVRFEMDDGGQKATCTWVGRALPYRLIRAVQVTPSGDVRMQYTLENQGLGPLPFLWSAHPLLPLTESTRLDVPVGAMVRVGDRQGSALKGMVPEFRWPSVRLATRITDLTSPMTAVRRYACVLFVSLPANRMVLGVTEGAWRLDLGLDGREVPYLALRVNNGERAPLAPRGYPEHSLIFAPAIGAPDSLATALHSWRTAAWVQPGEPRTWSLIRSARRLDPTIA